MSSKRAKSPVQKAQHSRNTTVPANNIKGASLPSLKQPSRGPPAKLPPIESSIRDPVLPRLQTPLPTALERNFPKELRKRELKPPNDDSMIDRVKTPPLPPTVSSDEHDSKEDLAATKSYADKKMKQSVEKYKKNKLAANKKLGEKQRNILADRPPVYPAHRDPKDYLDRLRTPSPVLVSPSPLSASLQEKSLPLGFFNLVEDRLKTPVESPRETMPLPISESHTKPPKKVKDQKPVSPVKPEPPKKAQSKLVGHPKPDKVANPMIERLKSPRPEDYLDFPIDADNFYFPDFDEESEADVSFIQRLKTPLDLPISRPFSRLNKKIPFYIIDTGDFPENGITDIKDYNNNLISLTDVPESYLEDPNKPKHDHEVSVSAPSSLKYDPKHVHIEALDVGPASNKAKDKSKNKDKPKQEQRSKPKKNEKDLTKEDLYVHPSEKDIVIDRLETDDEEPSEDVVYPRSKIDTFTEHPKTGAERFEILIPEGHLSSPSSYKSIDVSVPQEHICRICLHPLYRPVVLFCSHIFCADCMRCSLLMWSKKCPACSRAISAAPHVNAALSDQLASNFGILSAPDIGDTVRVLISSGKVPAYSCGLLTSVQMGFSIEGPDGIQVRTGQAMSHTANQKKLNTRSPETPCTVALVQCGTHFWQGRLYDLMVIDPALYPIGTRPNSNSLVVDSSTIDDLLKKPMEQKNKELPLDEPLNYMESRFSPQAAYTMRSMTTRPGVYAISDEAFEAGTVTMMAAITKRVTDMAAHGLLRICTDLTAWLSTPAICCVNCKQVARLPTRLKCGCVSCTICATDCYNNGWPCFGCGDPTIFDGNNMQEISADLEENPSRSLFLLNGKPSLTAPLENSVIAEIVNSKVHNPYIERYFPVYIPQDSQRESSLGLLISDPDTKIAHIMLKSGTIIMTDINRLQHLPFSSMRAALRVQTPLISTFTVEKHSLAASQLPIIGLTDLSTPRQYVTRYGKYKGTASQDRSLHSLATVTMMYDINGFLGNMHTLVDEVSSHNKAIRRNEMQLKYRKRYAEHLGITATDIPGERNTPLGTLIPLTNLRAVIAETSNEYFHSQFNTLVKEQEQIEREIQPFGTLECSRLSNYVKLLSSFSLFDFVCAACTRIVIRPTRLPCGHLACRTCATIYYVLKMPCLSCGQPVQSIADLKTDVRVLHKIYMHIPPKLHSEQIDCGCYVYKLANCNIGIGIVLSTVSRGGILFATVGFVRYIATFRLAELAVLVPVLDIAQHDNTQANDTPAPIKNPAEAIGEACVVTADGMYKDLRGLIVRKTGAKANVLLTVVLEAGIIATFKPGDLSTIKLLGPLCNYNRLKTHAQYAEKMFIARERYETNLEIEEAVRRELGTTENLHLAGPAPPTPKTLYSCMLKLQPINSRKLLFHKSG